MAVDLSIYQNLKPVESPSMLESAGRALSLSQLAMQNKKLKKESAEDEAIRGALSGSVMPDGSLDRKSALSAIAKTNPMKAMEYQSAFNKMDAQNLELKSKQMEKQLEELGFAANLAMSAKDQQSYETMLDRIQKMGRDISHMPRQFDPSLMRQYAFASHKQSERLAAEKMRLDSELAKQKAQMDMASAGIDRANKLRSERSGLPTTKTTQDVAAAYNRVQEAAKQPSAAGDLSLIFGYMKMLDPGSTVREGEFANAQNAAGVPQQISNLYNRIQSGERLSPEQRADFLKQARGLYSAQISQQKKIDRDFERLAIKSGVNPDDILLNVEANEPEIAGPAEPGVMDRVVPPVQAGSVRSIKPDLKEIGGKRYVKVKGGWEEVE